MRKKIGEVPRSEMPVKRSEQQPEQIDPKELLVVRERLFSRISDVARELTFVDRNHTAYRVMEHSVDDGFELARRLGLGQNDILSGFSNLAFIRKHNEFARQFSAVLENESRYLESSEAKTAHVIVDLIKEGLEAGESRKELGLMQVPRQKETKDLIAAIDNYYLNFLRLRGFKEKEAQEFKSTGESHAEVSLRQAELALAPHYYTGGILLFLKKQLDKRDLNDHEFKRLLAKQGRFGPDESFLFTNNIISGDDAKPFLAQFGIDIEDKQHEAGLKKARYSPLAMTFEARADTARRALINELRESLILRGHNPKEIGIALDEKSGKYEVGFKGEEQDDMPVSREEKPFSFEEHEFRKKEFDIRQYKGVSDFSAINGKLEYKAKLGENRYAIVYDDKQVLKDEFDTIEFFNIKNGCLIIAGKKGGKLKVLTHQFFQEPESELNDDEKKKLRLLNLLQQCDLESIRAYFKEQNLEEEERISLQRSKDFYSHSKGFALALTRLLKQAPHLFLDMIRAKKDNARDWHIRKIIYELFPEIPKNKQKQEKTRGSWIGSIFGHSALEGGESKPTPESYLGADALDPLEGGDPMASKHYEVMNLRESIDGVIATNILGRYNNESRRWEAVEFPVSPDLREPVKEFTIEVSSIGNLDAVNLPLPLGGEILKDRVKGIDGNGNEIPLDVSANALGQGKVYLAEKHGIVRRIVYSVRRQEVPACLEQISKKEYENFKTRFTQEHGHSMSDSVADIADEEEIFLRSIEDKEPNARVAAIERFVRDISYYDFQNGEILKEKRGRGNDERLGIMKMRLEELRQKNPELKEHGQKKYAGVCADFAVLAVALLRKAGFVSGVLTGFRSDEKSITTKNAHGTAFVVWPKPDGKYHIISVDGTPMGINPEEESMLAKIRQLSLSEKEEAAKEKEKELIDSANKKLKEIEDIIKQYDIEKIKSLSNGDLEAILNIILTYQVKKPHLDVLERLLGASRYAGFDAGNILSDNIEKKTQAIRKFKAFLNIEVRAEKAKSEGAVAGLNISVGAQFMDLIMLYGNAYAKDPNIGDKRMAYDLLEKIVDFSGNALNDVEQKAAIAVIMYLKAKEMVKMA